MKLLNILVLVILTSQIQAAQLCDQLMQDLDIQYPSLFEIQEVATLNYQESVDAPSFEQSLLGSAELIKLIGEFDSEYCQNALTQDQITFNEQTLNLIYTIDDSCDGGNSYGYITDAQGLVVATIQDSDIYCQE